MAGTSEAAVSIRLLTGYEKPAGPDRLTGHCSETCPLRLEFFGILNEAVFNPGTANFHPLSNLNQAPAAAHKEPSTAVRGFCRQSALCTGPPAHAFRICDGGAGRALALHGFHHLYEIQEAWPAPLKVGKRLLFPSTRSKPWSVVDGRGRVAADYP